MSGFTPVFDTVYDGTLGGKWPTLPVWLSILPMADKNGCIELTYQMISARTGWPLELLKQGIAELMAPDPESRTAECEGRRLELLDEHRNWGWRVINHGQYRNKARKASFDADRTASGADAKRKRDEREASRLVPTCPDTGRHAPPSDSDSDSDSNTDISIQSARASRETNLNQAAATPAGSDAVYPVPTPRGSLPNSLGESESEIHSHILEIKADWPRGCPHEDWITAEKLIRNLVLAGESWDVINAGVCRYAKFCKATNRMVKNPATWFGDISRPWLSPWAIPPKNGEKPAPNHDAEWAEAKTLAKEIGFRDPYPVETASSYAREVKSARDTPAKPPIAERLGLAGIKRIGAK